MKRTSNANFRLQRRVLQALMAIGGLAPVMAGFCGILLGPGMTDPSIGVSVPLDSHYRYLSGLLLAVGLGFWSTVPRIEKHGDRFRMLSAIVVIGGLGRLASIAMLGLPDTPMLLGLGMELIVTPLLAVWQYRFSVHK